MGSSNQLRGEVEGQTAELAKANEAISKLKVWLEEVTEESFSREEQMKNEFQDQLDRKDRDIENLQSHIEWLNESLKEVQMKLKPQAERISPAWR